jgi:uncharacterized protein (UPF0212 family)
MSLRNSLSLKLAVYYIISVLFIVAVVLTMTYFAYQDSEHAEHLALENSEIGLGYLNGATPDQR